MDGMREKLGAIFVGGCQDESEEEIIPQEVYAPVKHRVRRQPSRQAHTDFSKSPTSPLK